MIVFFRLNGVERTERVPTTNANFARFHVERIYPGAIVTLILPGSKR